MADETADFAVELAMSIQFGLEKLTDEQRRLLFEQIRFAYCIWCGRRERFCPCRRDE